MKEILAEILKFVILVALVFGLLALHEWDKRKYGEEMYQQGYSDRD